MVEKIYDIFHPNEKENFLPPKKNFFTPGVKILIFSSLIFILIFLFFYYTSKTTIFLYPTTENVKISKNIKLLFKEEQSINSSDILFGKIFSENIQESQTFIPTGKSEDAQKSEGKITVYNSIVPPKPISLVQNTRFLSADGKIFKAKNKFMIPPAKVEGKKIIPGSIEIEVVAENPGEEYNIGPTKFSIPGLAGSEVYSFVFGESKEPMQGGKTGSSLVIVQKDIDDAKNILQQKMTKHITDKISDQYQKDFFIIKDGILLKNVNFNCDHQVNEKVDKFSCIINGEYQIPAILLSDLNNFWNNIILNSLGSSKNIVPNSQFYEYQIINNNFPDEITLKIDFIGKTFENIPEGLLVSKIQGRSESEIENIIFQNYPQIKNVKIIFWPTFLKRAPYDSKRIKVEIAF
ncbi:MAG: hypothetical protein ACP5H7_02195 [Minisyncoccia bacterium]